MHFHVHLFSLGAGRICADGTRGNQAWQSFPLPVTDTGALRLIEMWRWVVTVSKEHCCWIWPIKAAAGRRRFLILCVGWRLFIARHFPFRGLQWFMDFIMHTVWSGSVCWKKWFNNELSLVETLNFEFYHDFTAACLKLVIVVAYLLYYCVLFYHLIVYTNIVYVVRSGQPVDDSWRKESFFLFVWFFSQTWHLHPALNHPFIHPS